MTISDIETLSSQHTQLFDDTAPSTPLRPRRRSKQALSLSSKASSIYQQRAGKEGGRDNDFEEDDENVDDDDDDDDSTVQLAHTSSTRTPLDSITASYSSIRSDLKQGGSPVHGKSPSPRSKSTPSQTDEISTPAKESSSLSAPLTLTPRYKEMSLSADAALTPQSLNRANSPSLRARSGTPATMGGFERADTPASMSMTEPDTTLSDIDDDQSQSAYYGYPLGEEPSEYIPPTIAKVGGFGVGTAKVKPQKDSVWGAIGVRKGTEEEAGSRQVWLHNHQGNKLPDSDSWGANFWCIIEQPNGKSFFANPQTGECAWAVPSGTFVLPPRPEGQWWELFDEEKRLSYYYHTKTKETQWEKPRGFVIPLASIQESTMGKRFSRSELNGEVLASGGENEDDENSAKTKTKTGDEGIVQPKRKKQPAPPRQEPSGDEEMRSSSSSKSKNSPRKATASSAPDRRRNYGPPPLSASVSNGMRSTTGLSTIASSTDLPSLSRMEGKGSLPPPTSHYHRSYSGTGTLQRKASADVMSFSSGEAREPYRRERDPEKRKLLGAHQENSLNGISNPSLHQPRLPQQRSAPIFVNKGQSTTLIKRANPLPTAEGSTTPIASSFEEYAAQHFAVHRSGLLRRKSPLKKLISWQKEPLRSSLLPLDSSEIRKDALRIFKVILRYFGDRSNPVFWPKVPPSNYYLVKGSTIASSIARHGAERCRMGSGNNSSNGKEVESGHQGMTNSRSDASNNLLRDANGPTLMEEVKWVIERCLVVPALRDETFVQTMKQMTGNEDQEKWYRGWLLLCIFLSFFTPCKSLGPYLVTFLHQQSIEKGDSERREEVEQMAQYSLSRITQLAHHAGHRQRGPTIADIEAAEIAAFNPQVFGQTLEVVMARQAELYPDVAIPIVLQFLTTAMLSMDCLSTPGIFRVPGDGDLVYDLQKRIDEGKYSLQGIISPPIDGIKGAQNDINRDVSVIASTFKLWLRQLKDSIFPESMYNDCLKASENAARIMELCLQLDTLHLRVVLYVVAFLQLFCTPLVISKTGMSIESIALIFAPNFIRSSSQDLEIVNNNVYYECKFVENLLRHLPCSNLDPNFKPSFDEEEKEWVGGVGPKLSNLDLSDGDGDGMHLSRARVNNKVEEEEDDQATFLGIGRNGVNLTPRSRKSSMVKS